MKVIGAFEGLETTRIEVAGCNTIYWHFRRQSNGKTVLSIERFDLRFSDGKWAVYETEVEFYTCAAVGGCNTVSKRDPSGGYSSHNKRINKAEATAFVGDFAKVWFRKLPTSNRILYISLTTPLTGTIPNWEALAFKIATPDFKLKSGGAMSLAGQTVKATSPTASLYTPLICTTGRQWGRHTPPQQSSLDPKLEGLFATDQPPDRAYRTSCR